MTNKELVPSFLSLPLVLFMLTVIVGCQFTASQISASEQQAEKSTEPTTDFVFEKNKIKLNNYRSEANFIADTELNLKLSEGKGSVVNLSPALNKSWDLSQYHGLKIVLTNTSEHRIMPLVKVASPSRKNQKLNENSLYLEPKQTKTLLVYFYITGKDFEKRYPQYQKMNAAPSTLLSHWRGVDVESINLISFSAINIKNNSSSKASYLVKEISPFTYDQLLDYPAAHNFPFVDKYGQHLQAQYPGKLQNAKLSIEEQWRAREQQELVDLKANIEPENRSTWGGWLNGPKQKATGNFYTKQIDGKWWFVDPQGYLFWSHGVTGVGHKGANTLIKGRAHYFKDLPSQWGEYRDFYSQQRFDFTQANLFRKYGENWKEISLKRNHQRLKSWGMNTYGNWSQPENAGENKTPFTVAVHYKTKMLDEKFPDPWDKNFANNIKDALLDKKRDEQADSPWNIGFFVDNELHFYQDWSYAKIITSAKKNQPAKLFFVDHLKNKYGDITKLNSSWKTTFISFNALLANRKELSHQTIGKDGKWFYQQMVDQYYRICRDSVKSIFPNHLYLGSRVHGDTNVTVLRAAEKYADVISYNLYHRNLKGFTSRAKGLTKPLMATEFHFGAMDRGVFHTGLQAVSSQQERAQHYYEYVKSALNNPLFVGTHWFQYRAQAITGRGDGENYQIGLVDITDTPYPETIDAVRKIGYQLYETRWK